MNKETFESRVKAAIVAEHNKLEEDPKYHWREGDISGDVDDPGLFENYAEGTFHVNQYSAPLHPSEKENLPQYIARYYQAEDEIWITASKRTVVVTNRAFKA